MTLPDAGAAAPNFTLLDLDGKTIVLNDVLTLYPVLLVFFRSDCELCQWALPQLTRFEVTFKGQDIEIYYVTSDPREVVLDTLQARRLDGLHVLLDPDAKVAKEFGVSQLPAVVFIYPDATVAAATLTAIAKELKEQTQGIRGPIFGAEWTGAPCPVA
jgi:peroxiredoxin